MDKESKIGTITWVLNLPTFYALRPLSSDTVVVQKASQRLDASPTEPERFGRRGQTRDDFQVDDRQVRPFQRVWGKSQRVLPSVRPEQRNRTKIPASAMDSREGSYDTGTCLCGGIVHGHAGNGSGL